LKPKQQRKKSLNPSEKEILDVIKEAKRARRQLRNMELQEHGLDPSSSAEEEKSAKVGKEEENLFPEASLEETGHESRLQKSPPVFLTQSSKLKSPHFHSRTASKTPLETVFETGNEANFGKPGSPSRMRMLIDRLKKEKSQQQSPTAQSKEETHDSEPESPSIKPTKLDIVLKRARYLKFMDKQKAAEEKERLESEIKHAERKSN